MFPGSSRRLRATAAAVFLAVDKDAVAAQVRPDTGRDRLGLVAVVHRALEPGHLSLWSGRPRLGEFHRQAEALGQQARALAVLSGERPVGPGEADMVQRPAERQAVLARQPDPLAAWPGQLRGVVPGRLELPVQDVPEQPRGSSQVADAVLDEVEPAGGPGSGSSAGPGERGVRPCWATWMTMPWAPRGCRKASFQSGLSRLTPTGSIPCARILASVSPMSVTMKSKWCGPAPRVARKPLEERRVRAAGGGEQLDLRSGGEIELAPPVAGGVAAVGPGTAEDAAEQLPAVGQGGRADGEVIKNGGHGKTLPSAAAAPLPAPSRPRLVPRPGVAAAVRRPAGRAGRERRGPGPPARSPGRPRPRR